MKTNLFLKHKRLFRRLLIIFSVFFILVSAIVLGLLIWSQVYYDKIVNEAQQKFPGNKLESLLAAVGSDTYPLAEKNRAIWALGVLKNKEALPKLESLRTFRPCNGVSVCQYELNKAILKIKGEYKHEYISSWLIR